MSLHNIQIWNIVDVKNIFLPNFKIWNIAAPETEAVWCLSMSASLFMEMPNATWLLAKAGLH